MNYEEGRKHGEYRAYYEDGTVWKEGSFKYDDEVYQIEYSRQGLPLSTSGEW
ncbi:MAG: hypothetical protein LIP01_14440 [Tannerellaceae bacterium]|nr:hypothetical protein [Tannerellaceae bacterium]